MPTGTPNPYTALGAAEGVGLIVALACMSPRLRQALSEVAAIIPSINSKAGVFFILRNDYRFSAFKACAASGIS
jgi:hypothetical protein